MVAVGLDGDQFTRDYVVALCYCREMGLAEIIAMTIAATSPQSCHSTMYGHRADDVYPSNGKVIGYGDTTDGVKTIWFQRSPRLDVGVAHRTLPLGSWVILENPFTKDRDVFRVIDRGPYSKRINGKPATDVANKHPEPYSSCVDITYLAGVKLHHSGSQRIRMWPVPLDSPLAYMLNRYHGCNPPNPPRWWRTPATCRY